LNVLNIAVCGTSSTEILEQSNCFIFTEEGITAFNGEIFVRVGYKNELGNFAVTSSDLISLIAKFPDEDITLSIKGKELILEGQKKRAGLAIQSKVLLPINEIAVPDKMGKIKEGLMGALKMASKICSVNNQDYRISHVQITSEKVQATDKLRFLRIAIDTGLKFKNKSMLIPAGALSSIPDVEIIQIKPMDGWMWLANKDIKIGICCAEDEYFDDSLIDSIIEMENPNKVQLPDEMINVIDRAIIMAKDDSTKMSKVKLTNKSITVKTQKDSGWYEERQPVKYKGEEMELFVGLSLFKELLNKTNKAYINQNKMKMKKDNIEFLVCLGE